MAEMNIVKINWAAYSLKTGGSELYSSNNNYSVGSGIVVSVGGYHIVYVCACACMCERARTGVLKYSVLRYF